MSAHAILMPSDCDTWRICTAKPLMVAGLIRKMPVPDEHEQASKDGTASHWAMAEIAVERVVAEGQITDDGHLLSQEMIDGAQLFVDDVATTVPHIPRSEWHVEERVYMHGLHTENWGTPDLWVYDPGARVIYLWDYKFGHGIVEVFENWQLLDYLWGILAKLGITDERHVKVVFTIVQPRAFHTSGPIRRWHVNDASNLRRYWNQIHMAAEEAMSGFARAIPNKNCGYCEARHVCQALQKDTYRSADLAELSVPVLMSPIAVGVELSMLEDAAARMQARIEGLKLLGEDMARSGQLVQGWSVKSSNAREEFDEAKIQEVKTACELFDVKPVKEKLLTPNQVRDALAGKGLPRADALALVKGYVLPRKTVRKFERDDESEGRRMFDVL